MFLKIKKEVTREQHTLVCLCHKPKYLYIYWFKTSYCRKVL